MHRASLNVLAIMAISLLMAAVLLACAVEPTPETSERTVETLLATQPPVASPSVEPTPTESPTATPTAQTTPTQSQTATPTA